MRGDAGAQIKQEASKSPLAAWLLIWRLRFVIGCVFKEQVKVEVVEAEKEEEEEEMEEVEVERRRRSRRMR